VLENTAKEESGNLFDLSDPKYVAVVVQYEAKIDDGTLADKIHALSSLSLKGSERLPRKRFKFQLAAEDISDRLTGFIHNAVTPFGIKAPIPVIICQRVLDVKPYFIYLGGGAVDMKLGLSLSDLLSSTGGTSIGYVSRLRSVADEEDE
jgi:prolyl-tRNA editing enzyme YbaK/EbsC (Cys-tRNA(Pro) deacylase)